MVYYHITDKEAGEKIQKDGYLIPDIGRNTQMAKDFPVVYFTPMEDVPVWKILLGKECLLACDIEETLVERRYTGYREYMGGYRKRIYPKKIWQISVDTVPEEDNQKANEKIGTGYLWFLNLICLAWARYYNGIVSDIEDIQTQTKLWLEIMNRVDMGKIKEDLLDRVMTEMQESCCYAFTDIYDNTPYRMWEQLIRYPKDAHTKLRKQVYTYVAEKLTAVNRYNTGGWIAPG